MNISWHDKNPIEYKPDSLQIEGYKLTSIETSNDIVNYVTGGRYLFKADTFAFLGLLEVLKIYLLWKL